MATPAQIAANRANALKSTGPRTPSGKNNSRFNALQHGADADSPVIPGEDPAAYQDLVRGYYDANSPDTPAERFHVDAMIRADWQQRRLARVEADLHRALLAETPGASLAAALLTDSPAARLLARVQRQLAAFQRAWYRAHTELHRGRRAAVVESEAAVESWLDQLASFPPPSEAPRGISDRFSSPALPQLPLHPAPEPPLRYNSR